MEGKKRITKIIRDLDKSPDSYYYKKRNELEMKLGYSIRTSGFFKKEEEFYAELSIEKRELRASMHYDDINSEEEMKKELEKEIEELRKEGFYNIIYAGRKA